MSITKSNSDDGNKEEIANNMLDFTRKFYSDSESSDEENTDDELVKTYILLYSQWKEACMV